jgi:hypothetical protein
VKIFQALAGNTPDGYFSKTVTDVFAKQTNDTSYTESDIDRHLVNQIVDKYDLTLDDPMPQNSGMVALVFFAHGKCCCEVDDNLACKCDNVSCRAKQRFVLKTKRRDIRGRISRGHAEFVSIYRTLLRYSRVVPSVKAGLESVRSLADTRDYILTQCEFDEEIIAMRYTKEDLAENLPEIAIPTVYNDSEIVLDDRSNTDFILMEHFDGCSITALTETDDLEAIFTAISRYAGATIYSEIRYSHADIHMGNIICMRNPKTNGLIVGVIDFGMNSRMDGDMKALCIGMYGSVADKLRNPDKDVDILRRARTVVEPPFEISELDAIPHDKYIKLNACFMDTLIGLVEGDFNEQKMHAAVRELTETLDNGIKYRLSYNVFKLLMGQSMVLSCVNVCVPDLKVRNRLQRRAMKWAATEL